MTDEQLALACAGGKADRQGIQVKRAMKTPSNQQ